MSSDAKPSCCTPSKPAESQPSCCGGSVQSLDKQAADFGSTDGMVKLDAGSFLIGTESDEAWLADGEGPVRECRTSTYYISKMCVTNEDFARFVADTRYQTEAERFGWSYVFHYLLPNKLLKRLKPKNVQGLEWWYGVEGAFWKKPEGPGSNIKKRMDHPVIHMSWNDAIAYCRWRGCRLPTEAEWERAARGGLEQKIYAWGDELHPEGKHRCNIWQGKFPTENTASDGFIGTAPTKSYRANGYGLYNVAGNVWEWCSDWFCPEWRKTANLDDPLGPDHGDRKLMKGGSYLCHDSYCNRYRVAARTSNTPDTSTGNVGFRIAKDANDT